MMKKSFLICVVALLCFGVLGCESSQGSTEQSSKTLVKDESIYQKMFDGYVDQLECKVQENEAGWQTMLIYPSNQPGVNVEYPIYNLEEGTQSFKDEMHFKDTINTLNVSQALYPKVEKSIEKLVGNNQQYLLHFTVEQLSGNRSVIIPDEEAINAYFEDRFYQGVLIAAVLFDDADFDIQDFCDQMVQEMKIQFASANKMKIIVCASSVKELDDYSVYWLYSQLNGGLIQESEVFTAQDTIESKQPTYSFETEINVDMKNAELSELLCFGAYHSEHINELLDERFKYHPTTVVISKDGASIAWMFEGCLLDITDADEKALTELTLGKNEHGKYIYLGELVCVEENVYSANGTFLPSAEALKQPISEEVDFYVVFTEDRLYLVTEALEIEELKNYSSDGYFKYNN